MEQLPKPNPREDQHNQCNPPNLKIFPISPYASCAIEHLCYNKVVGKFIALLLRTLKIQYLFLAATLLRNSVYIFLSCN